jgi:hypothetical protein
MMTTDQRTARAIQRASEERAHVWGMQGRPGFYTVKSATDASERYTVAVSRDGRVECSCRAAFHGNPCWHAAKVENRLIRQGRAA